MKRLAGFALALTIVGALPSINSAAAETAAADAAKTTHLFAIGVCPPWKTAPGDPDLTAKWAASCKNDVQLIMDGLRKNIPASNDNVTTLIDDKATYDAVITGLARLAKKAQPADRVIIYINTHGGEIDSLYKGYPVRDEVFAFYSEKEPENFQQAVEKGPWISGRALRDLIDDIVAEELVVIVESCHSAASYDDFRYDLAGRYREGWKGREAIIYSAGGDQIANFAESNDVALFTKTFADILSSQKEATLGDAFQEARVETQRNIRERCMTGPYASQMQLSRSAYLTFCTQQPTTFDPYGLLDDIKLDKRTESAMR
jgi:hypothetical protein